MVGCNEEVCQPTAWLIGAPDYDSEEETIIARVGIANTDGVEFGAESSWIGVKGLNQSYGAYAIQRLQVIELGTQYLGAHASIVDADDDGGLYGFVSGLAVPITDNIEAVTEYQFNEYQDQLELIEGTDDAHKVYAGLRIKF
jgi:hypothetical protein